mmetsp:Transcript_52846/g.84371  ORF Transcript_52846/g.84371 Transcript_52846/m.84371 type:complete len:273 (-) Transcript_52846:75-893(-)
MTGPKQRMHHAVPRQAFALRRRGLGCGLGRCLGGSIRGLTTSVEAQVLTAEGRGSSIVALLKLLHLCCGTFELADKLREGVKDRSHLYCELGGVRWRLLSQEEQQSLALLQGLAEAPRQELSRGLGLLCKCRHPAESGDLIRGAPRCGWCHPPRRESRQRLGRLQLRGRWSVAFHRHRGGRGGRGLGTGVIFGVLAGGVIFQAPVHKSWGILCHARSWRDDVTMDLCPQGVLGLGLGLASLLLHRRGVLRAGARSFAPSTVRLSLSEVQTWD